MFYEIVKQQIKGKIFYMAPEQLNYEKYGIEAELYSVGVLFYQILMGQVPFQGRNQFMLSSNIEKQEIKFESISSELENLLRRMLKFKPEDRIKWSELMMHDFFEEDTFFLNSSDDEDVDAKKKEKDHSDQYKKLELQIQQINLKKQEKKDEIQETLFQKFSQVEQVHYDANQQNFNQPFINNQFVKQHAYQYINPIDKQNNQKLNKQDTKQNTFVPMQFTQKNTIENNFQNDFNYNKQQLYQANNINNQKESNQQVVPFRIFFNKNNDQKDQSNNKAEFKPFNINNIQQPINQIPINQFHIYQQLVRNPNFNDYQIPHQQSKQTQEYLNNKINFNRNQNNGEQKSNINRFNPFQIQVDENKNKNHQNQIGQNVNLQNKQSHLNVPSDEEKQKGSQIFEKNRHITAKFNELIVAQTSVNTNKISNSDMDDIQNISDNKNSSQQICRLIKTYEMQAIYDEEVLENIIEHLVHIGYININYLNEGSFGIVLSAKSLKLMKKVAIKIVLITPLLQQSMENIQDEVTILKKVQFKYILEYIYHEICQIKKKKFTIQITELCDNSLDDELDILRRNKQSLQDSRKFQIVLQILDAINFIHTHKIVHRDLKASNILIKDGIPKIGDFGCSIINDKTLKTMKGTPIFMAPEVFEQNYKFPADIYSLGIILLMIDNPLFNYEQKNSQLFLNCLQFQKGIISDQLNFNKDSILYKCAEQMIKTDPNQRMNAQYYIEEIIKYCQLEKIQLCKLYSYLLPSQIDGNENIQMQKYSYQFENFKRIKIEYDLYIQKPIEGVEVFEAVKNSQYYWRIIIQGPKGSFHEGQTYELEIFFDRSYPFKTFEKIQFITPVFNINQFQNVEYCCYEFKISGEYWSPHFIAKIFIQSIVNLLKNNHQAIELYQENSIINFIIKRYGIYSFELFIKQQHKDEHLLLLNNIDFSKIQQK